LDVFARNARSYLSAAFLQEPRSGKRLMCG
jgi:hypothetical protein